MCGNGLRAVGRYCKEQLKVLSGNQLSIKTMNSTYELEVKDFMHIKIKMAEVDDREMDLAEYMTLAFGVLVFLMWSRKWSAWIISLGSCKRN